MKVVIRPEAVVWVRRLQGLLFVLAILLLGYTGFVYANTWIFQHQENARLERVLRYEPVQRILDPEDGATPSTEPAAVSKVLPTALPDGVPQDGLIGRIRIPRLDMSVIVMEGTDEATLQNAAGHIAGSALPGQSGNVGIAGHRDTLFRPLRNVKQGDIVLLGTPEGEYRYRVVSFRIVDPDDVSVLDPGESEILTLVTCYPFYFIGPSPNRFIVRAERVI